MPSSKKPTGAKSTVTPKQKIKAAVKTVEKKVEQKAAAVHKRISKKPAERPALKENRLELLFLIVNRNKAEYYIDLMESFEVQMQLVTLAHGTASASTLALLHLNDSDKTLIMGVIKASKIKDALATLEDKFKTIRNGQGIAYTVPMTGVIGALIFSFLSNNKMAMEDKEAKQ